MSIRARIVWYGIGVVCLVLVVTSGLFGLLLVGSVPKGQDQELRERAAAAVTSVQSVPSVGAQLPLTPVDALTGKDIVVMVLDQRGSVLATTGLVDGAAPRVPAELLAEATRAGSALATVSAAGAGLRMDVRRWRRGDGSGFVVAAQAVRRLRTDQAGALIVIVVADMVALAAAAVAIRLVAGRALRPLRQLAATADEVGRSADLSRRLPPVATQDDLGRLTVSFNAMMERLQHAYGRLSAMLAAQQRFTADASHELRTPLATIRSNAGFLRAHPDADPDERAGAVADIDAESGRMSRLVDDLLVLARADDGQPLALVEVDLARLAEEVAGQAGRTHPGRRFEVEAGPAVVRGDAGGLRRLLWILVDNAVLHTDDGGRVRLGIETTPGLVHLRVADDGHGIPPGMQDRIFERFVRADPSRRPEGTGLGLAIARSIVTAHGGHITAANNDFGGATLSVRVPSYSSDS
jgi:signal transduction histidine kinase